MVLGDDQQTAGIADEPGDEPGVDPMAAAQALERVRSRLFSAPTRPVVLGRHVILDRIGSGGAGVVYRAYDPELERRVAIKVLRPDSRTGGSKAHEPLLREARALAKLTHPNVVAIYDVQEAADLPGLSPATRCVFVVMELVQGQSLQEWLTVPRPWREVLKIYLRAGHGLLAAHVAGLLHRDFKPANVLLGDDGRVRVADFGLASPFQATVAPHAHSGDREAGSESSHALGTPAYMAPEQHCDEQLDPRTDQYAFCLSLWEGLYATRPFCVTDSQQLLAAKLQGPSPAPKSAVPTRIARILARGLAPDPGDRYASMAVLLAQLERDPVTTLRRAIVFALVLVSVGGVALWRNADQEAVLAQCASAGDYSRVWNPELEAQIADAFTKFDPELGPPLWTRSAPQIEAFARAWQRERIATCERTLVAHEQDALTMSAQVECLGGQIEELTQITALFSNLDDTVLQRAPQLLDALPQPHTCLDVTAALPSGPQRSDLDSEERRATLSLLRRAEILVRAGRVEDGRALAAEALERAQAQSFDGALARANEVLGSVAYSSGEVGEALAYFREAEIAAERGGDDERVIRVLTWQAEALAWKRDFEAADAVLQRNRAKLERVQHTDLDQRVMLEITSSSILAQRNEDAAAIRLLRDTVDLIESTDEALPATRRSLVHTRLVWLLLDQGALDDALHHAQRAHELMVETYGPRHPLTAASTHNLAHAYFERQEFTKALELIQLSESIKRRAYGEQSPTVATTRAAAARVLASLGRSAEAVELARAAVGDGVDVTSNPEDAGFRLYVLAVAMRANGDPLAALDAARRSDSLLQQVATASSYRFEPLVQAAAAAGELGDREASVELLRTARQTLQPGAHFKRAKVELAAAAIAWAHHDRKAASAALSLARDALAHTQDEARQACTNEALKTVAEGEPPACWTIALEPPRRGPPAGRLDP